MLCISFITTQTLLESRIQEYAVGIVGVCVVMAGLGASHPEGGQGEGSATGSSWGAGGLTRASPLSPDDRICSPPFMELTSTSLCGDDTMRLLEKNGLAFPFSAYWSRGCGPGGGGRPVPRGGWRPRQLGRVCPGSHPTCTLEFLPARGHPGHPSAGWPLLDQLSSWLPPAPAPCGLQDFRESPCICWVGLCE